MITRHIHLLNLAKKIASTMFCAWTIFLVTYLFFNFNDAEGWLLAVELSYLMICTLCLIYINNHKENVKLPKINKKF